MNDRQRKILIVCAALIGAMLLYPPFQILGRGMGYAWIFTPPHEVAIINAGQLLVQWVAVALLGGIAFVLAKDTLVSGTESKTSHTARSPSAVPEGQPASPPPVQCRACGNRETVERKRSFLGFQKCHCTVCGAKFDDSTSPLSKAYRIVYWVVGVWFGILLLGKIPALFAAAAYGPGALIELLVEHWAFILFTFGAIWALRRDAAIRRNLSAAENAT